MMKRIWGYSWYPVECQIADGFGNICDHPVIGKGKFFRPVEKVEAYAVPEADIKKSPAAKPGIFENAIGSELRGPARFRPRSPAASGCNDASAPASYP